MTSLNAEQKQVGSDNYYEALGVSRRDFLKGVALAGVTSGAGLGAMYFGYGATVNEPVRVGVIGTGDEGGVLIGALNPEYIQVKAICDMRPYSQHRAFHGDWASDGTWAARPGLMSVYDWKTEDEARKNVSVYSDYNEMLKDPNIEAVIIATPLFMHAPMAIAAMRAGKHVLTEKLMAFDVGVCKDMSRVSQTEDLLLATGHQRHYSVLYDNAVNLIQWGLLGEIHHIRAQWHRGNLPGRDSWKQPIPGGEVFADGKKRDEIRTRHERLQNELKKTNLTPQEVAKLEKQVAQWAAWNEDRSLKAEDYGYVADVLSNGHNRSAMEELCRWRLWDRTGGGLMAELGSHQLDAASIFISALRRDGKKAHPLSVHAVGGRHIFPVDRDAHDHVYCTFEFPGPGYDPNEDPMHFGYKDPRTGVDATKGIKSYDEDPNKRIVMTYSSINGNGYGGYGEVVLGTKGTLVLEREKEVMLYKKEDTASRISVKDDKGGPTMDSYETGASSAAAVAQAADTGPISRGYTEEMEHWAWCIRNRDPENQPRCKPEVALGDAVIALACNVAMKNASEGKGGYLQFDEAWFDINSDATPDGSVPKEKANG
ncbi:MAG: dehydrogenase [Planctomycetaceae bacterium]|nr:dehydrogenase [Planctomycetaceae bacterium]